MLPDQGDLKKKAAKAIDKDDKKKMGDQKHATFMKIRKILEKKNEESRSMAKDLEAILEGGEANTYRS